jgi:hypothetical protein
MAQLLSRKEVAAALTAAGYPITQATLATMASRGGGPPYTTFGKRVLYHWELVIQWAEDKTTRNCETAAEHKLQKALKDIDNLDKKAPHDLLPNS